MDIVTSFYTGKLIRLTRIELEKYPEALAEWSKDASLARSTGWSPISPDIGQ